MAAPEIPQLTGPRATIFGISAANYPVTLGDSHVYLHARRPFAGPFRPPQRARAEPRDPRQIQS